MVDRKINDGGNAAVVVGNDKGKGTGTDTGTGKVRYELKTSYGDGSMRYRWSSLRGVSPGGLRCQSAFSHEDEVLMRPGET